MEALTIRNGKVYVEISGFKRMIGKIKGNTLIIERKQIHIQRNMQAYSVNKMILDTKVGNIENITIKLEIPIAEQFEITVPIDYWIKYSLVRQFGTFEEQYFLPIKYLYPNVIEKLGDLSQEELFGGIEG